MWREDKEVIHEHFKKRRADGLRPPKDAPLTVCLSRWHWVFQKTIEAKRLQKAEAEASAAASRVGSRAGSRVGSRRTSRVWQESAANAVRSRRGSRVWGETAGGGEGEGGKRRQLETSLFGKDVAEAVAAAVAGDAAEARAENRAPSRRATPPQGYGAGSSLRQRSELDRMVDTALQTIEGREASHEAGAMLAAAVAAGAAAGATTPPLPAPRRRVTRCH